MLCRCSGLAIQSCSALTAPTSGDDQSRFSPTDQEPWGAELEYVVSRFQKGTPPTESWAEEPSASISDECPRAAVVSTGFSFSGARPCAARIAFNWTSTPR